ncbi:MAG: dynamin family protein [Actinomycetota bacterium]
MTPEPRPGAAPTALSNAFSSLRKRGRARQADRIEQRYVAVSQMPAMLVVVGQLARGKSTLVNALVGDPYVSPTGDGETTAVPIVFTPPAPDFEDPAVRLRFIGGDRLVQRSDLTAWVTVTGEQADHAAAEGLLSADVACDAPGLSGIAIVDTPGAGGLSELHAKRAVLAAERAAVLLAVTDANGRLTRDAVHFLRECAEFAHSVVVAVNKIDRNRVGWRRVVEDNRAAVAGEHFPDIEFVGVSAVFAVRALAGGGDEWMELSRVPELRAALAARFARADELPMLVALRQVVIELASLVRELEGDVLAASGTPAATAELEEQQSSVDALSKQVTRFGPRISSKLTHMQVHIDTLASERLREFDERWRAELSRKVGGVSKTALAQLRSRMVAELEVIGAELQRDMLERSTRITAEMFASAGVDLPSHMRGVVGWDGQLSTGRERGAGRPSGDVRSVSFMLMGAGLGRAAAMPLGGMLDRVASGAVGGALSIAGIGVGLLFGGRIQNRQQLLDDIPRASAELREQLRHALTLTVSAVRDTAVLELREAVDDELRRMNAQLAASRQAKRASDAERQKHIGDLTAQIRAVQLVLTNAETEIDRLSIAVGNNGPSPSL